MWLKERSNFPKARHRIMYCLKIFLGFLIVFSTYSEWNRSVIRADEVAYKIGLANVCITPQEPVWLDGYAGPPRDQPFDGVLDDLHAKAMAFEDALGNKALLITADLCCVRKTQVESYCAKITQVTGLKRNQILFNFSHTHSGPIVGLVDADMFALPADQVKRLRAYSERLQQQLTVLAVSALADLRPGDLAYGIGSAPGFVINRRVLDKQGKYASMGLNHAGPIDSPVPVLRVNRTDGSLRAVLFGLACHPISLGGILKVSGDLVGAAQTVIEQQSPGVQAMFMQGCGADADAEPGRGVAACNQYGNDLAAAVSKVLRGPMRPICGSIQTELEWVDLPLAVVPCRRELEQRAAGPIEDSYTARHLLGLLDQGRIPQTSYNAPIALWRFGQNPSLLGLPGDTASGYATMARERLGNQQLWAAGYCNDICAYLPTSQILAEGGYECRGMFGPDYGWMAPEVERTILDAIQRINQRIVAPDPTKPCRRPRR